MATRILAGAGQPQQDRVPLWDTSSVQLTRMPAMFRWTGLVFLTCSTLMLTVVMLARMNPLRSIVELPTAYLPHNPLPILPKDAQCNQSEYVYVACRFVLMGEEVTLSYQLGTRMIVRTAVKSPGYRVGDLMAVWGDPRGIIQRAGNTYLYWEAYSVILYSDTFEPDSQIDYVVYDLTVVTASPWHGFMRSKH